MLRDKGPQARFNRTASISQADHTLPCASIPTPRAHLRVTLQQRCGAILSSGPTAGFSEAANQTPDRLLGYGFLANRRRAGSPIPLPESAGPGQGQNGGSHGPSEMTIN